MFDLKFSFSDWRYAWASLIVLPERFNDCVSCCCWVGDDDSGPEDYHG